MASKAHVAIEGFFLLLLTSIQNMDFYHYTDTAAKEAIERSKVIYKSEVREGDAAFGDGVYGTSLTPGSGKLKILLNNYDGTISRLTPTTVQKVEWAFKVKIPSNQLSRADSDRDILIYEGDLCLDGFTWEVIPVEVK